MMKRNKHFFLLRLKYASLPELIYRTKQSLLALVLRKRLSSRRTPFQAPLVHKENLKDLQLPHINGSPADDFVDKILQGFRFTLNTEPESIEEFDKICRNTFFAAVSPTGKNLDVRAAWEPARLQHLVILLKYLLESRSNSNGPNIQQFVKETVLDWIHKNPFLFGPHYISAMECALRIPVFFYCLKSLTNLDAHEHRIIFETIYRHGWWVSKRLSLYSSLGNHTVAESVGLIFAGAVFRKTKKGRQWLEKGKELLKQELNHQILDDGGPAEQSLNYHRFVLDLYWLSIDFLEKNKLGNCSDLKNRLTRAERFIIAFKHSHGRLEPIGDSDDGYAIAPGLYPRRVKPDRNIERLSTFSTSGYTIINYSKSVLIFDHGPLGMRPLYNHGHADALSITFSADGKKLLVDPGTYRYNGEPEFRKYFRGTRAHNTVTIDGLDQAVQETGFIWSHPYDAKLIKRIPLNGGFFLQANHNGYAKTKEPVLHFRSIVFFEKTVFFIKDTFLGKGVHTFELNYHIHPDSEVSPEDDGWWKVNNEGTAIFVKLLGDHNFALKRGLKDPLFGWYSPSYGVRRESGVLSYTTRGTAQEVSFGTAISTNFPQETRTLMKRLSKIEQQAENT